MIDLLSTEVDIEEPVMLHVSWCDLRAEEGAVVLQGLWPLGVGQW